MKNLMMIWMAIMLSVLNSEAADTIYVCHNKVTTLQFPDSITNVIPLDGKIEFEVGGKNLEIKTSSPHFKAAHLKVRTIDDKVYDFNINYSYGRAGKTVEVQEKNAVVAPVDRAVRKIDKAVDLLKYKKLKVIDNYTAQKIKASLYNVLISGDSLFFRLHVDNRSNINFDVDFIRFYIRDVKTAKRTVTQEQELYPLQSLGLEIKEIPAKGEASYVFVLPKFPLPKSRALYIEVYEKSGARHLYLKMNSRKFYKVKPLNLTYNHLKSSYEHTKSGLPEKQPEVFWFWR